MTTNRRLGLGAGLALGAVGLALVLLFAVLLPAVTGDDDLELPDSLPGGWVAADVASVSGGDRDATEQFQSLQRRQRDYANRAYDEVYDEPVALRVYVDRDLEDFVVVTVFTSEGGAFGPGSGLADPEVLGLERSPSELSRHGDVVCIAQYQPVARDSGSDDSGSDDPGATGADEPAAVSCQLPAEGRTTQVSGAGLSLEQAVALTRAVADRV